MLCWNALAASPPVSESEGDVRTCCAALHGGARLAGLGGGAFLADLTSVVQGLFQWYVLQPFVMDNLDAIANALFMLIICDQVCLSAPPSIHPFIRSFIPAFSFSLTHEAQAHFSLLVQNLVASQPAERQARLAHEATLLMTDDGLRMLDDGVNRRKFHMNFSSFLMNIRGFLFCR